MTVKFTGQERDAETGLDFFGARYFSGAQGRFATPDWSPAPVAIPYADLHDPQSLNLYAYLRNDPLSSQDPDGHGACEAAAGGDTGKWLACKGVVGQIAGYTLQVIKDTAVGAAKEGANTVIGLANTTNKAVNAGLSLTPTDFRFQPISEFDAATSGEGGAMLGMAILAGIGTGGEASEVRLTSGIGRDESLITYAEEAGRSFRAVSIR
jgi:RHS repeat-associated protein